MAELPDYLREFDDTAKTRQLIYDGCLEAVKNRFPVEDDTYRLELADVHYDGPQDYSLEDQKQALMKSKNLRTPMKGRWRLIHKPTNSVLGEREDTILQVPYYTDRGTIINNGNDYSIISQMRLRPGVYARRRRTGELESHFNIKSGTGRAFRFELEPESGAFKLTVGQSHVPLYPILKAIGVTDQDMMKYWGADIVAANAKQSDAQALKKTYQRMAGAKADENANQLAMGQFIKDAIEKYQVDPEIVARTMGIETDHVTPELMLRATQKLLDINRGDAQPDNRDNPRYASVYSIEDLMRERIDKDAGRLTKSLLYKVRRDRSLNRLPKNALTPYLDSFILGSGLTMPGEETNPLSNLTQMNRISRFGEGGIRSDDAVPMEAHDVHGDWMGFVDPVAGPEGLRIGVDVRASYRTFKGKDKKLYGEFINARTGKEEFVDMGTAADRVVAFPGQDMSQPYVFAMKDDVPTKVKTDTVDYVVPSFAHLYGTNTNINPMPTAVQAGRQFYGSKFWEQYLPQVKGEVPLVDSLMPDGKTTFTEFYGRRIGTMRSPVDGTVVSVKDNEIIVKDGTGKKHKTTLVSGLPFNRMSVTGDTKVFIRRKGRVLCVRLDEYTFTDGDEVQSYDPDTCLSSWMPVTAFLKHTNTARIYRVHFESGRYVDCTDNHSLLTLTDNFTLGPIYPKDCILGLTKCPVVFSDSGQDTEWTFNHGLLDGLYLSEGCVTTQACCAKERKRSVNKDGSPHKVRSDKKYFVPTPTVCNIAVDPLDRRQFVCSLVESLGYKVRPSCMKSAKVPGRGGSISWTSAELGARWHEDFGKYAAGKHISGHVFSRGHKYLHGLLAGYLAGDGCLWHDTFKTVQVEFATVSRELQYDIVSLCNILGILAMPRESKYNGDGCLPIYRTRISTRSLTHIAPLFGYPDRQRKLESLLPDRSTRATLFDNIPVYTKTARQNLYSECPGEVPHFIYKSVSTSKKVAKHRITHFSGTVGKWANSDILWDTIVELEELPQQKYVYDFSVDKSEAFATANGTLVHNSSISYTPSVKVGQDVHKGDMLANSNYTDAKTGAINMGQNLRVAILPYKGQSVSGDTNVLWRYGVGNVSFGPIKNIVPGDGMASLTVDPETLEQSYAKCNALMIHKPDTKMYLVKTLHGRQVKVTGSHSMMVYDGKLGIKELKTTDLIAGQHFLPVVPPKIPFGESDSIICQSSTKSLEVKLDRDFGWLIGIFLSEGYVDTHSGSKVIDISCTENDIVANLRRICTDLGVRHGYSEYKSVVHGKEHSQGRFKIYCSSLATWVNDHCGKGAANKYLPDVTWTAPREFAEGLIDAYICGDGSIGKECRISTISHQMAEGLCFLMGGLGIMATYRTQKARSNWKPEIIVRIYREFCHLLPDITLKRKDQAAKKLAAATSKTSYDSVPIPESHYSRRFRKMASSRSRIRRINNGKDETLTKLCDIQMWWDMVDEVLPIPSEDYVYDLDMQPTSTFVVNTGIVVHNSFEDAHVISESAAKKMATDRMYSTDVETRNGVVANKNKYIAAFPNKFTKQQFETLDEDGMAKVGTELHKGDPIVVAIGPKVLSSSDTMLGKLSKTLRNAFTDKAEVWEHDWPGVVTDAVMTSKGARVNVKTTPPVKVGDKLCYSDDTQVLTEGGWKNIADLTLEDKVCTLNPENRIFEYVNPAQLEKYEHDGKMYSIRSKHIDLMVTLDHNMYVDLGEGFRFYKAEEIVGKKAKYLKAGLNGNMTDETESVLRVASWGDPAYVGCRYAADKLQQDYLHAGMAADVVYDGFKYKVTKCDGDTWVNEDPEAPEDMVVDYDGYVYCCTMPKWHIIYVRRNGKACWSGNSGRFGLKGVVGRVVSMDEMPRDAATNQPYDMLVNPMGFLSRVAPGQLMEIALGKVAKHTGQQVRLPQLPPPEGWATWTKAQLDQNGLKDSTDIFDPETGKTIKNVGDGYMFVSAFHHLAEKKASSRGTEASYTQDDQPAKGGSEGAKRMSGLDLYALLSHGATDVIKDYITIRGTCFDASTEVLTRQGWKSWDQVTGDDELFTKDKFGDGTAWYEKPEHLVQYTYEGDLYGYENKHLDWLTTPDHNLWGINCLVSKHKANRHYRLFTASDIFGKEGVIDAFGQVYQGSIPESHVLEFTGESIGSRRRVKDIKISLFDYCSFMGWWLSEGFANYDGLRGNIYIAQDAYVHPDEFEEILNLGQRIGLGKGVCLKRGNRSTFKFSSPEGTYGRIRWRSKPLAMHLLQHGHSAWTKRIPDIIFEAPLNCRLEFLRTYILGDGYLRNGKKTVKSPGGCTSWYIGTTSREMAEGLQRLAVISGFSSWYGIDKHAGEYNYKHDYYGVSICRGYTELTITKRPASRFMGHYKQPHLGPVYCAVMSTGLLYVRRNGKCMWSGNCNEEFWRALRLGLPIPEPGVPFIYNKFLNTLKAGGINVVEKGNITQILPLTDKDIDQLSGSRLITSSAMVDSDLEPVKGGLFDPGKTGGNNGNFWSAIPLPEPVPNPIMEEPIRRVLGLTTKKLEAVLSGEEQLNGKTGGEAIKDALKHIDIDDKIAQARLDIKNRRGSVRDNAVKVLGYLNSMKEQGLEPSDWMISKVPVLPPKFRPASKLGDVIMVSDINDLYKEVIENAKNFEELHKDLPDSATTNERLNLYRSVKAAYGLGESITPEGQAKGLKGAIRQVIGSSPKFGMFQRKVISKTVDTVSRNAVTPDPNLDMDQVGIPENSAWEMYKPFVMRALVRRGYPPVTAIQMLDKRDATARQMLEEEMEKRPVLMDRAPTWHKFNIMAFKPSIVDSETVHVSPLIVSGFNMDFDGDENIGNVVFYAKSGVVESAMYGIKKTSLQSIRHLVSY